MPTLRTPNSPPVLNMGAAALRVVAMVMFAASIASCSMIGPIDTTLSQSKPLVKPTRDPSLAALINPGAAAPEPQPAVAQTTQFFKTPVTSGSVLPPTVGKEAAAPVPTATDETISAVTLDGLPLPQFINTIYATILKRNVSLDPAVQARTDLVSLRTGKPQTASQLAAAVRTVLQSYAVSVNEFDGLVRVVPSAGVGSATPEVIRGRAQPDVPGSLRPIFYLMELDNTNISNVTGYMRTLFQGRVTVTDDGQRNAIMLSGQSDSVMAAVEVIQLLDKPLLRNRYSARIAPVFWSATDMATRLIEVLTAQGYYIGSNTLAPSPILLLPIGPLNSVVVFAVSEEALNHTLRWARELDQTPSSRSGGRYITYYVRNTDASEVAKTLQDVLGGGTTTAAAAPAGAAAAPRVVGSSRVVVNVAANSIIIQSSPAEYQQIYSLLQELDRPSRSALIMATVAEVSLSDDEQFGFNWLMNQFNSGGYIVNGGMGPRPSGTATSASGIALNIASVAGDPRALLTALATSSRVRVLSNPSVVTISGQTASIQVGEDVPILTSQISNSNTGTSAGQGILQTVQYRNVGVILKVKPTIRAGGRVDLEIAQEVSGVSTASTGLGNSPVVNTRRVETRLSTTDGNTMLIGGLIREQREGGNAGLPWLKDIPLAGALFRSSANNKTTRTELVLLITPHVMEDDFESRAITEAFRGQFNWSADIPFAAKERAQTDEASRPDAAPIATERGVVSEPYVVPKAVVEQPLPATPRIRAPEATPATGTAPNAAPPVPSSSSLPAVKSAPAAAAKPQPLADEKVRQELLNFLRQQ